MATKTRSKHQGLLYAAYKAQNKQTANRKRKLVRLQKEQPNNEQIALALTNIKYRRHNPNTPHWSHTAIHYAHMFKQFKKKVNMHVVKQTEKEMFSLKERAHAGGVKFWNNS